MIDKDKMRALVAKLRSMPEAYDVELPTAVEAADAIDLLLAEVEAAKLALRAIADQDPVEMALDPTWTKRVANAALSQQTGDA